MDDAIQNKHMHDAWLQFRTPSAVWWRLPRPVSSDTICGDTRLATADELVVSEHNTGHRLTHVIQHQTCIYSVFLRRLSTACPRVYLYSSQLYISLLLCNTGSMYFVFICWSVWKKNKTGRLLQRVRIKVTRVKTHIHTRTHTHTHTHTHTQGRPIYCEATTSRGWGRCGEALACRDVS